MTASFAALLPVLQRGFQVFSHVVLVGVAILAVGATALSVLGVLPWAELSLRWGGQYLPDAGLWLQVGLTLLLVMICFFLPANARMQRLENSHRNFALSTEDVRRAYEVAHAADRRSVFSLSSDFDAVRKRMEHLRAHPDLSHLEPELLELAAQMSHESRTLARVYSDERVDRARLFLRQRQEEAERMTERLALARTTCDQLRRWLHDIEAGERTNAQSLKRLEADLREILPHLGYEIDEIRDANVVTLPKQIPQMP